MKPRQLKTRFEQATKTTVAASAPRTSRRSSTARTRVRWVDAVQPIEQQHRRERRCQHVKMKGQVASGPAMGKMPRCPGENDPGNYLIGCPAATGESPPDACEIQEQRAENDPAERRPDAFT